MALKYPVLFDSGESLEAKSQSKPMEGDGYAIIADEVRSIGNDVVDSLLKIMLELKKSNEGSVYAAAKKYVEQNGLGLADYGFFGIVDRFIPEAGDNYLGCPADIGMYVEGAKVRTNDVLVLFYLDNKGFICTYYARVLTFDPGGRLEVTAVNDGKVYWVSKNEILGKLTRVFHFGEPEWFELIDQIIDRRLLEERLVKTLERTERNDVPEKKARLEELKRRLAILASGHA